MTTASERSQGSADAHRPAAGGFPEQRVYRAHATLDYLTLGARLPAPVEARVRARLAPVCSEADTFIITDRCGQTCVRLRVGMASGHRGVGPPGWDVQVR